MAKEELLEFDGLVTEVLPDGHFRVKLEGVGYGFLIPVFFVASGLQFDLSALFSSASTVARVPLFLLALLVVRGSPALLYRPLFGRGRVIAAGLLQATSLPFIVAASRIGVELQKITPATSAALVAAGLLSVLIFPLGALLALRRPQAERAGEGSTGAAKPTANP